jgi:NAD+ kinase
MKIAVVCKFDVCFRQTIIDSGLEYDEKMPDLVISLGGDGTFFRSERKYPNIPKLMVKKSKHCKKCAVDAIDDELLGKLKNKKYKIEEHFKLYAKVIRNGKITKKYYCVNDFVIRNREQINALRFSTEIDGKIIGKILIGDGVVVATPFGSTAYFKSITGESFNEGFGIAFNNLTEKVSFRILKDNSKIKVKILRTDGILSSDNDPDISILKKDDEVEISKSSEMYSLVKII